MADPRQYGFFDELVAKLDVKSDPNTRNEVIQLKHAAAKDVAEVLTRLVTGQNTAAKTAGQDSVTRGPQSPNAPPSPPLPGQPATPATVAVAALSAQALSVESGTNQFSALLTILPDDRSNALVISGTIDDIRLIRELVAKIDILLAQVRIEVVIAEVTLTDSDKSGISALNLTFATDPTSGRRGITAFDGTVAGWAVTSGIVNPLSFKAAMGDTGSRSNVKLLSAPTIVTSHNKQAEVIVGQQQPIVTGVTSTPNGAVTSSGLTTSSQVTYKNIAIDLKVTPLIGDDGSVQLTIDQTVDDVLGNVTIDNNDQPIIGHRQATSFVTVKDGEMIVLGGLQRTKRTLGRTKIGFLYEIPILSHLLGGRTNGEERTELLLFIRPHILRTEESTQDTVKQIDDLSNKAQVNQYLVDPTKKPKESLLEKLK